MKRFVITFLVLVIAITSYGQTKAAQISFENLIHDFGTIKEEGGTVTYKFEFVNTGGNPLIVTNVRPTCGCTSPDWTREPVPPGGKGFVAATFNPKGRPNAFNKYLYVDSNSETSNTKLTIKGVVTPKPKTIEDEYRYNFGDLRLKKNHLAFGNITNKETKENSVEVINTSDQDISLALDRCPAHITVKFNPAVIKPGETGIITATYDASKKHDWGMVIDRAYLIINGVNDRSYSLVISANVTEDFSNLSEQELADAPKATVENNEVKFGTLKQSENFEHDFTLKNSGKSTLFIRKIKASCGCTAVQPEKMQIEPGESVNLHVIFNSAGKRGNQNKSVTIITNDPTRSSLVLYIKGEVLVE